MAETTSMSLLQRLQLQPSSVDWQRLVDLYQPLIRLWLSREPGLAGEVDDLTQEILTTLIEEIPHFQRQREGSFRTWLRTVTANRIRLFWRHHLAHRRPLNGSFLDNLADPNSELSREWDRQHDIHLARRLMELIEQDFAPRTWQAFTMQVIDGQSASNVAARLGLTVNAVLLAKSHVMSRLREEIREFLDS